MAAKVYDQHEKEHFAEVVEPAIKAGTVEFLGELGQTDRDALYAGAAATLMLGAWPEPFGLVAIESMATGTPVIARRAGALTETIDHGETGFLVDDEIEAELAIRFVRDLDRESVRMKVINRFSPERMADEYEAVYRDLVTTSESKRTPVTARA
jgi:glycosyltransferase involved in cell wall biosynthesis